MPYIGKSPSFGVRQRYQYTATASQTTFSGTDTANLTLNYTDNNFVDVYQNGVLLKGGGNDYTATSGTSVVLGTGATADDVIEIIVYDAFSAANFYSRTDSDSRYLNVAGDTMTGSLDLNGTELVLDVDGDTSITADTDDQIDIKIAGSDSLRIKANEIENVSGDLTIDVAGDIKLDADGSEIFFADGGTDFLKIQNDSGDAQIRSLVSNGDIAFIGNDGGSNVEVARFDMSAGGHLFIGTGGANEPGSSQVVVRISGIEGQNFIKTATTSSTGYDHQLFINANAIVGSITTNGSGTSFNTSSDYRLKENVVTDYDATTRLKQLKPSRFNFKADKDTTLDGFLAHEVQSIVPEAVTGEKDGVDADGNPKYQGIDQGKLVPLLTKALQESIARADALEARIKKLEDG